MMYIYTQIYLFVDFHRPFRINLFSFVDHTGGGVGGGVGGGGGGGGGTGPHHLALCPPLQVPRHWPGSSAATPSTLCACQRGGRLPPPKTMVHQMKSTERRRGLSCSLNLLEGLEPPVSPSVVEQLGAKGEASVTHLASCTLAGGMRRGG